ncbi:MAG: hypothetical protein AAF614_42470 [Chloroflexota bacterium]
MDMLYFYLRHWEQNGRFPSFILYFILLLIMAASWLWSAAQANSASVAMLNSTIFVGAYHDDPIDGEFDPDEEFIAGITISLYDDSEVFISSVISAAGTPPAQFSSVPLGKYWVCQEDAAGWFNTDPGTVHPTLGFPCKSLDTTGGQSSFIRRFGIAEQPTLNLVKVNDSDGDGSVAGESRLAGFTLTVYDEDDNQVAQGVSTALSSNPLEFSLPPGDYTVCETPQAGWYNTDPGTTNPTFGNQPCKSVTLPPEPTTETLFFLNAPWPTLNLIKVNDSDGDGSAAGESRLAGFTLTVYDATKNQVGQGVSTALSNNPLHISVPPGTYTVCETPQTGWYNTDPGTTDPTFGQPCKPVTVDEPGIDNVTFLNAPWPTFNLIKVNDSNGDGSAAGESRLEGFSLIVYDAEGDEVGEGISTSSSANPLHISVPPGDYTICEKPEAGWTNTDPGTTNPNFNNYPCKSETVTAPGVVAVRFLNAPNCAVLDVNLLMQTQMKFNWSGDDTYNIYRVLNDPYFTSGTAIANNEDPGWTYTETTLNNPDMNAYYVVGDSENCGDRLGTFTFTIVPGS